jgi:hypothetical protein
MHRARGGQVPPSSGQERTCPFLVTTFDELLSFLVFKKWPLWWASLYSHALTTICVDEVPAPRSRPTTVRQGNGGLKYDTTAHMPCHICRPKGHIDADAATPMPGSNGSIYSVDRGPGAAASLRPGPKLRAVVRGVLYLTPKRCSSGQLYSEGARGTPSGTRRARDKLISVLACNMGAFPALLP